MAFTQKKGLFFLFLAVVFLFFVVIGVLFVFPTKKIHIYQYVKNAISKISNNCLSQLQIDNVLICTESKVEGYNLTFNKDIDLQDAFTQLSINLAKNPKNYLTDTPSYGSISKNIQKIKIQLVNEEQKHLITQYRVTGPQAMSVGFAEEKDWLIIKVYVSHTQISSSDIELATNNYIFYSLYAITNNWPDSYNVITTVSTNLDKIYGSNNTHLPFVVTSDT